MRKQPRAREGTRSFVQLQWEELVGALEYLQTQTERNISSNLTLTILTF